MRQNTIFVVGDSHSTFWNGKDSHSSPGSVFSGIDILHMGPVTAFNLSKPGEDAKNAETIDAVARRAGQPGAIIACFGEIDCRTHIIPRALNENRTIADVVAEVGDRYLRFLDGLAEKCGCPIIVWAPPPTPRSDAGINRGFPRVGTVVERNYVTAQFIRYLRSALAARTNIALCSLFDELIEPTGETRPNLSYDGWHLTNHFLGRAIELVKPLLHKWGLPHLTACFDLSWPIATAPSLRNVAVGLVPVPSSNPQKRPAIPPDAPSYLINIVSTAIDQRPFVTIPLDSGYLVHNVEFHFDGAPPDLAFLCLTLFLERKAAVYMRSPRLVSESVVSFDLAPPKIVLHARLDVERECALKLRTIRVMADSYLAAR